MSSEERNRYGGPEVQAMNHQELYEYWAEEFFNNECDWNLLVQAMMHRWYVDGTMLGY